MLKPGLCACAIGRAHGNVCACLLMQACGTHIGEGEGFCKALVFANWLADFPLEAETSDGKDCVSGL